MTATANALDLAFRFLFCFCRLHLELFLKCSAHTTGSKLRETGVGYISSPELMCVCVRGEGKGESVEGARGLSVADRIYRLHLDTKNLMTFVF